MIKKRLSPFLVFFISLIFVVYYGSNCLWLIIWLSMSYTEYYQPLRTGHQSLEKRSISLS